MPCGFESHLSHHPKPPTVPTVGGFLLHFTNYSSLTPSFFISFLCILFLLRNCKPLQKSKTGMKTVTTGTANTPFSGGVRYYRNPRILSTSALPVDNPVLALSVCFSSCSLSFSPAALMSAFTFSPTLLHKSYFVNASSFFSLVLFPIYGSPQDLFPSMCSNRSSLIT